MFDDGGSASVIYCTFKKNWSSGGGGIFSVGSATTVTECTFSNNAANAGGGMRIGGGDGFTVISCLFLGNSVKITGGAVYSAWGAPKFANCLFNENWARSGAGIFNTNSSPLITGCMFTGNSVQQLGGAVYSGLSSAPVLVDCTISGNSAGNAGGGMYNLGGSPTVTNCVLWGNSPTEIADVGNSITTMRYTDIQGGWPGIGNIDADPLFVDPDNGDYHLSPGSPCIDAGDNTAVPKDIVTDLDGNPRFVDDPCTDDTGNGNQPIVDMGAYEFQGTSCDLNGDGSVGILDLLILLGSWGPCPDPPDACPADLNGDGNVGILDLLILLANWG